MLTVPRAPHLTERQKDAFTNQSDSGCVLEECCKKPWSHISYWECNRHIGHKWLPVITSALVVLNEEHYSVSAATAENTSTHAVWSQQGRLCLDRLVRHFTSPRAFSEESHPSRKKYHPSILYSSSPTKQRRRLSHEGISLLLLPKGQILLTNKTPTTPIFVASPCFVQPGDLIAGDWPVYRVAPACSLVVFDTRIYEDRLTEAGKYTPWPGKSLFGPVLHISLECVDIVEPLSTQSAKFSDASTKSSLLSEEIVVDAPQVSGRGNSGSDLIISDSSGPEDGAQMELSKDITENEPEVDQDAPSTTESDERTTAGNIAARAGGQPEDSDGVAPNDSPVANFYLHIVDLIEKISEITGHIDFAPPPAVDLDGSSELMKCRSVLNWRQEKVEQIETTLKETKKQLKSRDDLYESCRSKLLELQEKIIDRQQDPRSSAAKNLPGGLLSVPCQSPPSPSEGMGEYSTESVMPIHNQVMGPNINAPGDPLSGSYQRGPPMYQHPTTSVMLPGPNLRAPHIPQQQSVYNQMPGQMPVDMLQQQRFQAPMQPPTASRFPIVSPSGQHTAEGGMMAPVPTPDATAMPPVGHSSPYDGGFGAKPVSGSAGVPRTLPPPMTSQQPFAPQQPPISSPMPMSQHQQPQPNPVIPMRSMEVTDPARQSTRQPPMGLQQHQQVPLSLPPPAQQPVGTIPPMPPSGSAPPFPMPAQGTVCLLCSRDLTEPPAPPSSMSGKVLSCNYPPVQCEAGCRGWFHLHCSGLTPEAFYLLKAEGPLVEWLCTTCATQAYPNIPYIRLRH
ncbi:smad [Echinococcus granulosus]|uniref:Smad n=1 Tax=Echinococcus granulosus TaxID=6210 RepID=W6UUF5_ECHGR|nr:smad [Echinococcus granulosus]EUB61987.1 smad [Echinococcus granulosus]